MSVSDTKVIQMGQIPQAPENAGGKECDFVFRQSSEIKTKKIAINQSRFLRRNMILMPGDIISGVRHIQEPGDSHIKSFYHLTGNQPASVRFN